MSATSSRRGRAVVVSVCLVAAAAAGVGTWAVVAPPSSSSASASGTDGPRRHTTAPVTAGDLTESRTFAGTLGYGAPTALPGAAAGTLTWLPRPGDTIRRDAPLYAVDEHPVRAMYGSTPLWRELVTGVRGADVRQLNENLHALGYDVSVDDRFGPRTRAAVRQWQRDRGLPRTGVLTAQDIAFVDGEVRVAAVRGVLGSPAGGDVLSLTTTRRVVSASVPQRDAERLAVGTAVDVRVNGVGDALHGEVVDAVPGESGDGGATVDVTIAFDAGDRTLPAAASAQVVAKGETAHDVLSVPVSALVAARGADGYAVDVVRRDGTTKRVPVEVGLVADGRAAVTGAVRAGDRVVVPS